MREVDRGGKGAYAGEPGGEGREALRRLARGWRSTDRESMLEWRDITSKGRSLGL